MKLKNRYHDDYAKTIKNLPVERREEALEMGRAIIRGRSDPVFFGEYFLGLQFHPKQKIWLWLTTKTQIAKAYELAGVMGYELPLLEALLNHPFTKNILCPSNRWGKTLVTATKHLWYNFYKIGLNGDPKIVEKARYQTLNLSPHSMQVDALYRYIVDIMDSKFIYEWQGQKIRNQCKIGNFMVDHLSVKREVIFANNTMVKGAPTGDDQASSIAGTDFYYISYDEAPQSIHLREELPAKILSRLIDSGGPLDVIGTPEIDKPSQQYYHRIVKFGLALKDGWFTLLGSLDDNTFLSNENKNATLEAIRTTDPEKYRQVRFGEFISAGSKLFPTIVIDRLWDTTGPTPPVPNHKYLTSIDWGFSDTGDPTIIYVFDYTELVLETKDFIRQFGPGIPHAHVVKRESIKGGSPYEALAFVRLQQNEYNDSLVIHDASSMGGVMLKKMMRELGIRHLHDFTSDKGSKDEMLFLTARSLSDKRRTERDNDGKIIDKNPEFGKIRSFYIPQLEEQLATYRVDDKKIEQDEVIAFGMGVWFIEKKLVPNPVRVYDINLLASKPEQILQAQGRELKVRSFNIKERNI